MIWPICAMATVSVASATVCPSQHSRRQPLAVPISRSLRRMLPYQFAIMLILATAPLLARCTCRLPLWQGARTSGAMGTRTVRSWRRKLPERRNVDAFDADGAGAQVARGGILSPICKQQAALQQSDSKETAPVTIGGLETCHGPTGDLQPKSRWSSCASQLAFRPGCCHAQALTAAHLWYRRQIGASAPTSVASPASAGLRSPAKRVTHPQWVPHQA